MTKYTFTTITSPYGNSVDVQAINDSGQLVVGYFNDTTLASGTYIQDGSTDTFLQGPAGSLNTTFDGLSNNDTAVGYYHESSQAPYNFHGWVYANGSYSQVDYPNTTSDTVLTGINPAGTTITGSSAAGLFTYSNGVFTTLAPVPNSRNEIVAGINDQGTIVGTYLNKQAKEVGFIETKAGKVTTLNFGGPYTNVVVTGINDKGQVVGYTEAEDGLVTRGFVRSNGTLFRLKTHTIVTAINDQGQIAGSSNASAFVGTPQGGAARAGATLQKAAALQEASAACFATGTRIATARGEIAVEALAVDDLVVTASGATRPVRWIGHRALRGRPLPHDQQPIRVQAGAFGPGLPVRDLVLSPGHPVLVGAAEDGMGGHLVPIMCLVNGTSVRRCGVDAVTYWHVELDAHDILLAEGLQAESYLDWGDRAFFAEGSDHALHNPDFVVPGLAGRCRPVAVDGPVVAAERRRLDSVFASQLAAVCHWPGHAEMALPG